MSAPEVILVLMPAHSREALAKFQYGEVRLVYARHRENPTAPLYYLEDGTAKQQRAWAKKHLECFIPECSDPKLTTVARTGGRRDGFTHYRGHGKHTDEGIFHAQSKALILRWAAEQYPHVQAQPEEPTKDRARRADVMLTWPDSQQLAIEIQYASETLDKWSLRHNSYLAQGVNCLWIFGHTPPHLKTSKHDEEKIILSDLHRQMLSENVSFLWINPVREDVGAAVNKHRVHACVKPRCTDAAHQRDYWVTAEGSETAAVLAIDPLFSCTLTPNGISTPSLEQSRSQRLALNTARAIEAERVAAQNAELEKVLQEIENRKLQKELEEKEKKEAFLKTVRQLNETQQSRLIYRPSSRWESNYTSQAQVLSFSKKYAKCLGCALPLDPVWADLGRHPGC